MRATCFVAGLVAILIGAFAQAPTAGLGAFTSNEEATAPNATGVAPADAPESPPDPADEGSSSQDQKAEMVIYSVVPNPASGEQDTIVLRNLGGRTANLTGWKLTDANPVREPYVFGQAGCERQAIVEPGESLVIKPETEDDPCGFGFTVSNRDSVRLFNKDDEEIGSVQWPSAAQAAAIRLMPNGRYREVPGDLDVVGVLREAGIFSIFVEALEKAEIDANLTSPVDPDYTGPALPQSEDDIVVPNFPWWFGFGRSRSPLIERLAQEQAAQAVAPREEGVPELGPYTIFAPTDDAFEDMLEALGGFGGPLPKEVLLEGPEIIDILQYHIVPGLYNSTYLRNDTSYTTSQVSEIYAIQRPGLGPIFLHDACVDFPTPDNFDCQQQTEFGKCFDPFMVSPAPGWQGGYCQKACGRCTCDADVTCAEVVLQDLQATNGVVHAINRVLFPPPVFEDVGGPAPELEAGEDIMLPTRPGRAPGAPPSDAARGLPTREPEDADLEGLLPSAAAAAAVSAQDGP